jgi:hypothetical protein
MLRLSGKLFGLVVLLAAMTTAARAIPRVLTACAGTPNDATAVFTLRQAVPGPVSQSTPRKATPPGFLCLHSHNLELFPMFSGMLQQRAGQDRLCLLRAQRE